MGLSWCTVVQSLVMEISEGPRRVGGHGVGQTWAHAPTPAAYTARNRAHTRSPKSEHEKQNDGNKRG